MKKITKSDILNYNQCSRLSYLNKSLPHSEPNFYAQQGINVTHVAQKFLGADKIISEENGEESARLTSIALSESKRVGEASFQSDQVRLRLDLAWQNDYGLHFIEIKSSTHSDKNIKRHLPDIAAQIALLESCGTRVGSASIALLNKEAEGADAKDLFIQTDVSEKALAMAKTVNIARITENINREDIPLQTFCSSCAKCDHFSSCFPQYPEKNATVHIPMIGYKKLATLHDKGIYQGTDVPDEMLTDKQKPVIRAWRAKREIINHDALESAFQKLRSENHSKSSIHFLDFEVAQPAIPIYEKQNPYTHLPFQFSLHTRFADGTMRHREFLHDSTSDPTPHFLSNLILALGGSDGRIIVYTNYENKILESAMKRHPKLADGIKMITGRLFDLHEVVKTSLWHPDANGRTSIKVVLPILAPRQSYENLTIQNGTEAVESWMDYRESPTADKRQNLLDYCKQDTQAMIHLLNALSQKIDRQHGR